MKRFFVVACLFLLSQTEAKYSDDFMVYLNHGGGVTGKYMTSNMGRGIRAFMNIPYAEAPIGNYRFMDPVMKTGWQGIYNNHMFHDNIMCVHYDTYSDMIKGQEDCLYLNVYTPRDYNPSIKYPVIFFIGGYGNKDFYGPDYFLDHDVILVTGNYRTGPLGFMATNDNVFTGNYGLKDQIMMMKWIQDNIHYFGGDNTKVTLFGGHDGASMVGLHMMSPLSKGLFHQAIMQDGTQYNQFGVQTMDYAMKKAMYLFEKCGCSYTNNFDMMMTCMKKCNVYDMFKYTYDNFNHYGHNYFQGFGPVIHNTNFDKAFLTSHIYDMKDYHGNTIPVIVGINKNGGAYKMVQFLNDKKMVYDLMNNFDIVVPKIFDYEFMDMTTKNTMTNMIKDFYFKNKNFNNMNEIQKYFIDMMTDGFYMSGVDDFLYNRLMNNKNFGNTYVYLFNYRGDGSFTDYIMNNKYVNDFNYDFHNYHNGQFNNMKYNTMYNFGVCHNDDLMYLFPFFNSGKHMPYNNFRGFNTNDQYMQKLMTNFWYDFITYGNPTMNNKSYKWDMATKYPIDYFRIGNYNYDNWHTKDAMTCGMEKGFYDDKVKFWRKFYNMKNMNFNNNYDKFIKVEL